MKVVDILHFFLVLRTMQGYNTVTLEMHCLEFPCCHTVDSNSIWTAPLWNIFRGVVCHRSSRSVSQLHVLTARQERNVSDATPEGWASCASAVPVWNRMNNQHVMVGLLRNKAKSLVAHGHVTMTMRPTRSSTRICPAEPTLGCRAFQLSGISIFVVAYNTSSAAPLRPSERPVAVSHSRPHGARLYRREDFHRRFRPRPQQLLHTLRGHLMTSLGSQKRTGRGTPEKLEFLMTRWVSWEWLCHDLKLHPISSHFKKKCALVLFFLFFRKCFRCHAGKLTKCIESGFVYLLCWRMALAWYFDGTAQAARGYNKVVFCIHGVEFIPFRTFLPISDFRCAWTTLLLSRYEPHLNECTKKPSVGGWKCLLQAAAWVAS